MKTQAGFSYIDVMAAIIILMIGILGMVSALTSAVIQTKGQEQQLKAKQIATSAIESIIMVKETDATRLGWAKVGNVGNNPDSNGNPQGIFLNDFQSVRLDPGPDEVIGTTDDRGEVLLGSSRRIAISDECDIDRPSPICDPPGNNPVKVRRVEVTVAYYVANLRKEEVIRTVLTSY